jgi:hypothetical protein
MTFSQFVPSPRVGESIQSWLAQAVQEVRTLCTLQPGWDSYAAREIRAEAAATAVELLQEAARLGCPRPSIVPMSRGGIQIEWHVRNMNIECTIPGEGAPVEVWYEDLTDRSEHEIAVEQDPSPLRAVLSTLASRR